MAVISVSKTVSGAIALEIVAAISTKEGYQANISDGEGGTIPNPETDQQFAQRVLDERFVEYGKNVLNWHRNNIATQAVSQVTNGSFT